MLLSITMMCLLEFSESEPVQTSSYKFLPSQTGGDGNQQVNNRREKCIGAAATRPVRL